MEPFTDQCTYQTRYQLQLKEEFMKRTEKLVENEAKIKGEYLISIHLLFSSALFSMT